MLDGESQVIMWPATRMLYGMLSLHLHRAQQLCLLELEGQRASLHDRICYLAVRRSLNVQPLECNDWPSRNTEPLPQEQYSLSMELMRKFFMS